MAEQPHAPDQIAIQIVDFLGEGPISDRALAIWVKRPVKQRVTARRVERAGGIGNGLHAGTNRQRLAKRPAQTVQCPWVVHQRALPRYEERNILGPPQFGKFAEGCNAVHDRRVTGKPAIEETKLQAAQSVLIRGPRLPENRIRVCASVR